MESNKFDELTKTLATSTSRRQALKTLAATALGGLLGASSIGTAFAASPTCVSGGHRCTSTSQCCPGLSCNPYSHVCGHRRR